MSDEGIRRLEKVLGKWITRRFQNLTLHQNVFFARGCAALDQIPAKDHPLLLYRFQRSSGSASFGRPPLRENAPCSHRAHCI